MTFEVRSKVHRVTGGHDIMIAEMGAGPTVVFIHGSGPGASGQSNFRQNAQAFAEAGYRVLLPDLVGYGASSKPEGIDYTLDLFTDTLHEALLTHDVTKAVLVGNSLGGGIALQLALNHPDFVDRLILMAPGCIHERKEYLNMPGIAGMISSFGGPHFDEAEQRRLITNLVHDRVHVTDALVKERFAVARTQPKDVIMRMSTPDLGPRLAELTLPILLFWGYNERFMPLAGINLFFEACPDVRCVTFNKVGHWVQVERASEFNRYALEFLHG